MLKLGTALGILGLACGGATAQDQGQTSQEHAAVQDPVETPKTADVKEMAEPSSDPAMTAVRKFIGEQTIDKEAKGWKTRLPMPPVATFDKDHDYFWVLETNKGPIKIRFMPDVAPMHVTSTMYLTEVGFYDDLLFHRVIQGFMAQGGCPEGSGRGGPGYKYAGEYDPKVKHDRPGLLSMANTGRPSTDGSQFFLTFVPTPHLDGKHTLFGEIVEGMDTLKTLEKFGSGRGTTSERLVMTKASIAIEPKAKAE